MSETEKVVEINGTKLPIEKNGKVRIVNVGFGDVGGYDFDSNGKISAEERFDATPERVIELTPKRAEMLLRDDTPGDFMLEKEGLKFIEKRKAEAEAERIKKEKGQKKPKE